MRKVFLSLILLSCSSQQETPTVKAFCLPEVLQGFCSVTQAECESIVKAQCSPVKEAWLLSWKEHDGSTTTQLFISQNTCEMNRVAMDKSGFPGSCTKF